MASNPCWGMYVFVSLFFCFRVWMQGRRKVFLHYNTKNESLHVTCQATQKGGRGKAVPTLDPSARKWWLVSAALLQEITPVSEIKEVERASSRLWFDPVKIALTGSWTPDRPARSKSLYRLRYSPPFPPVFQYSHYIQHQNAENQRTRSPVLSLGQNTSLINFTPICI